MLLHHHKSGGYRNRTKIKFKEFRYIETYRWNVADPVELPGVTNPII